MSQKGIEFVGSDAFEVGNLVVGERLKVSR